MEGGGEKGFIWANYSQTEAGEAVTPAFPFFPFFFQLLCVFFSLSGNG